MADSIVSKTCSACKQTLPISEFSQQKGYRDGYRSQCRTCRSRRQTRKPLSDADKARMREYHRLWYSTRKNPEKQRDQRLRTRFGIGVEQYDAMLVEQKERCAICGVKQSKGKSTRLHVDHCHATGAVRGLLCIRCNWLLGALGDNLESAENIMAKVIEYFQLSSDRERTD